MYILSPDFPHPPTPPPLVPWCCSPTQLWVQPIFCPRSCVCLAWLGLSPNPAHTNAHKYYSFVWLGPAPACFHAPQWELCTNRRVPQVSLSGLHLCLSLMLATRGSGPDWYSLPSVLALGPCMYQQCCTLPPLSHSPCEYQVGSCQVNSMVQPGPVHHCPC